MTPQQEASCPRGRRWASGLFRHGPKRLRMHLSHGGNRSNRGSRDVAQINLGRDLAGGILLRAIPRDVTGLAALVAGLASSVKRATVGSSAVPGDVAELAAGVALHGLSLAVTGKVVGATALVASSGTGAASETTTAVATGEAAAAHGGATAKSRANRVRAGASKVTRLAAVVAAAAGASTAQAESRAVSLDVAQTLAVVALLSLGGTGKRAAVGLVARLLAVVAKSLSRGADLSIVANIATLVASTSRKRRHFESMCLFGLERSLMGKRKESFNKNISKRWIMDG